MAQIQQSTKPFFGPVMTPSTFATKWLAKFRDFLLHKCNNESYKSNEPRLAVLPEEGLDLILHFHTQATELNLSMDDFPVEPPPDPPHVIATANPFSARAEVVYRLDGFMRDLQSMKMEGAVVRGKRWGDLPLAWRQRMNEVFLKVEEARREGWWTGWKMELGDQRREVERMHIKIDKKGWSIVGEGPA